MALRVDLDAVRAARKGRKHGIETGGREGNTRSDSGESSSSSDHSSSSGGCRSGEDDDDDEDYYAGDSDSCSPRNSEPPPIVRPLSRPSGGAADVASFGRLREHQTRQRPSTTVALALTTDTKGHHHLAKSFKAAAGRGTAAGGSIVGYGWQGAKNPRREAPGSARPAVEAAAAVVAAEVLKVAGPERATTAARGRVGATATRQVVPAPRPAARLARKHGLMAGLSPPPPSRAGSVQTPTVTSERSGPGPSAAAAVSASLAAADAAAVASVVMPREFSPGDVCDSGTKAAKPSAAAAAAGEKRYANACCGTEAGFTTVAVSESARESKPENTPESDEPTTTSSGEESREQDLQASTLRGGDLDRTDACYKHRPAVPGKAGVGPGAQRKGRGDERRKRREEQQAPRSKRVFFASSSSGESSASASGKDTGNVHHQGSGGGGGGGDECYRDSTRAAAVPAPEPVHGPAAGAERGRYLYEQVIRIGGAAQPKMSPVRPLPKRRPRVVYESLW